ncbi:hypothetical protein GO986_06555 [Deinococcus sp. HMF7620]|uniref:Uncharacterized protein n=1 Tax=Deinococcus arboris TaxID=2682977 RepID=A0A7C9MQE1_9DEIO|nr:hypothetical protein [Deinococcus arboris]MVN86424.1 hypothetical protein [Deinococcus arboris]
MPSELRRIRPGSPARLLLAVVSAALLGGAVGVGQAQSAPAPTPRAQSVKATTTPGTGATFSVQVVPLPAGFQHAFALALNNKGHVLFVAHKGTEARANDSDVLHLWTGGTPKALALPRGFKTGELASSVGRSCLADDGRIVMNTFSEQAALLYSGGRFTPITFPNTDIFIQNCAPDLSAVASDLNTGQSYLWQPATGEVLEGNFEGVNDINRAGQFVADTHLQRPEVTYSVNQQQWQPKFINDAGLILGEDVAGDGASLYLWPKADKQPSQVARPAGTDAVFPQDLNETGQALVGYLNDQFIYTHATRTYRPIRVDGWTLQVVLALNEQGWVLAQATQTGQKAVRTVLLKPK